MMKKASMKKLFIWGIITAFIFTVVSYTFTIISARKLTPNIITEALNSSELELCWKDLTKKQTNILLAVEDPNFFQHKGIDYKTPGAGMTTITQTLVKQLYLKKFKFDPLKLKQNLISRFAFDSLTTKETQLKLFINSVYFGFWEGKPVYGFCDASRIYFKKEFNDLSEDEYLSLIAMIIDPDGFNVIKNPKENSDRVKRITFLINGYYKPTGLMDLYYGGEYFNGEKRGLIAKLVGGY